MSDTIANMLTQIRNAQAVGKETVKIPFSRFKFDLALFLLKNGYVEEVEKKGRSGRKIIWIKLKYKNGQPFIKSLKKISKPGQRIYVKSNQIKSVKQGYGLAIISTSQGLMSDKEARKKKLGGELICEIW